jgi:hypothetical protein
MPAAGVPALSLRALRHRRSSPPLIATLSTGLDELPEPPARAVRRAAAGASEPEPQPPLPMLRAVLRGAMPPRPAPAPAPATSAPATATQLPRVSPPLPPGLPLRRAAAARTRAPRRVSGAVRPIVPREGGIEVPAGSLHVWDLPAGAGAFVVSGTAAARISFLDRAGSPVTDVETVPGDGLRLEAPATASKLAVSCLGAVPEGLDITAGPGAVALATAARGHVAAVGWQDAALLARVAPAALLGRGASVKLGAPLRTRDGVHELIPATTALAQQTASETTLPAGVDVVLVILDARAQALPTAGPRVLATGATLSTPPLVVTGGRRLHLFYSVSERGEALLRVAIAADAWQVAGVLGLRGRAEEWAQTLAGGVPRQLIADGPLTATGSVTVNYEPTGEER